MEAGPEAGVLLKVADELQQALAAARVRLRHPSCNALGCTASSAGCSMVSGRLVAPGLAMTLASHCCALSSECVCVGF